MDIFSPNIHSPDEKSYTPYTYLIGWSQHDKWYYGVRYGLKHRNLYETGCHPDDLWNTYFTTSPIVKRFVQKHGKPDVIQIRKTFKDKDSAVEWEGKVIRRLDMCRSKRWLNQNMKGAIVLTEEMIKAKSEKQKVTKATRQYTSWIKGLTKDTDERVRLIGLKSRGRKASVETREKQSAAKKGKVLPHMISPKTEDHKEKLRQVRLKQHFPKWCCLYCHKEYQACNVNKHLSSCIQYPPNHRFCIRCGDRITSKHGTSFCGHSCSVRARHESKEK